MMAYAKLILFFLWTLLIVPAQMIVMLFRGSKPAYTIPRLWHKGVCRILGLRVIIEGAPCTDHQVIFLCNHLSYLDIPVIGSVLKASFIAKSEVGKWPVFGFLSKLQQTAFVSRSRDTVEHEKGNLDKMLKDGRSLIIFPEGTSTDGRTVIPFKSSLLTIAYSDESRDIWIQPMTLTIVSINGRDPSDQTVRDLYAWHGEMELMPHMSLMGRVKNMVIRMTFHEPIQAKAMPDRKLLATAAREAVLQGLEKQPLAFAI